MNKSSKLKEKIAYFSAYFIGGFLIGLLISLVRGCFHNAPMILWKETVIISLAIGLLSGIWGGQFLDRLFRILRYIF